MEKLLQLFADSQQTDVCFWGSESKTQLKQVKDLLNALTNELRKIDSAEEVSKLDVMVKQVELVQGMISAVKERGPDSEFQKAYDFDVGFASHALSQRGEGGEGLVLVPRGRG